MKPQLAFSADYAANDSDLLRFERPGIAAMGVGMPVLMLHSSMSSKAQWAPLAQILAPRFRTIALDLHGYGDNMVAPQGEAFSLDHELDLIGHRLQFLVAQEAPMHVVGHSFGALVALRFAQRHPARVASLTLYEPVAFQFLADDDPMGENVRDVAKRVILLVESGRQMQAAGLFLDYWNGVGTFARMSLFKQAGFAMSVVQVALDFRAMMASSMRLADCRAIHVPTLLLAGKRSPDVAKHLVTMLSTALPDAFTRPVDAGHMGPVTAPELVNPLIEAFISTR
jgi:pimeloyl-ACP methyl ester carboxylesterase